MYHYRTQINDSEEYRTALNIHVVPIEAGKSRILYTFKINSWLPTWIQHAASNRFLNTDSWIHDAEYNTRKRSSTSSPYILPTQSDFGVKAFRQWWVRHGFSTAPKNTFGPADFTSLRLMDRKEQIDPWKNHSRQCAPCRRALKVIQRIQAGGLICSFASSILLHCRPFLFLFTLSLSLGSYFMCKQLATVIEGSPYQSGYADRSPSHT
jgi:Pheophorbide a oxygenase